MKKKSILIFLSIFIAYSCSIKKRAYRPGYYIDWNSHKKVTKNEVKPNTNSYTKKNELPVSEQISTETYNDELLTLASADKKEIYHQIASLFNKQKLIKLNKDTCGDILIFRNGNELKVKVIEITQSEIKYKPCNNLTGPIITVFKDDVLSIKYPNGYVDSFIINANTISKRKSLQQKTHPLAIVAALCTALVIIGILICVLLWSASSVYVLYSILFGFIFAMVGVITAAISNNEIYKNPDKYKGQMLNIISTVICWTFIAAAVLTALFIFLLLLSI